MEDLLGNVQAWFEMIVGFIAAVVAWVSTKFSWWKEQNKWVRVGVFLGVFLAVVFVLSVLQGLLG